MKKIFIWSWRIVGAFAVVFGIWVGYNQIFQYPSVLSQITNETNVFDVNAPIQDLQVLFQGNDIQQNNLNLRIYEVKVINNGGTNITQNDFDQNGNWGIGVSTGTIIDTQLDNSNSDYITANLSPQIENGNFVKLNKIIFDKGDSFTIELLVLYNKNTPPVLYLDGKIAGINADQIEISTLKYGEPFLTTLFYGTWFINIIRFLIYFIFSVALFLGVLILIIKLDERKKRHAQSPKPPQQPS
ncbi:MAG TPA: hypothetical protein VIJ29_01450 [Candidatus Paceibacterota bacterium]